MNYDHKLVLACGAAPRLDGPMSTPLWVLLAVLTLCWCVSCGDSDQASICGSERPCVPEGTWVVSYDPGASGLMVSQNTVRIDSAGAEVIGETVPDDDYVTLPATATAMTP